MYKLNKAEVKMRDFIGQRLTGAALTIKGHKIRSMAIARVVDERFGVNIYQFKLKHILWLLSVKNKKLGEATQYNYWLTVRKLIAMKRKSEHWLPKLQQGSWLKPKAGK